MSAGLTRYSEEIEGARGNFEWSARFDMTDGYLGITQKGDRLDRVLLSPKQVAELLAFVGKPKRR